MISSRLADVGTARSYPQGVPVSTTADAGETDAVLPGTASEHSQQVQTLRARSTQKPQSGGGPAPQQLANFPAEIIILRHAEKPDAGSGLSPQGQERADALATALPERYPGVDFLFASAPSANSNRSDLTITPLSKALGLPINTDYADADFAALAQKLKTDPQYAGKKVVICWHHGKIPQLAAALGVKPPVSPWPADTFDRFWQINTGANGKETIQNLPQQVLPGDSTT